MLTLFGLVVNHFARLGLIASPILPTDKKSKLEQTYATKCEQKCDQVNDKLKSAK